MKLWKVPIDDCMIVLAENYEEAKKKAIECFNEYADFYLDYNSIQDPVHIDHSKISDIPESWRDICPLGDEENVKSCIEFLKKEMKGEL